MLDKVQPFASPNSKFPGGLTRTSAVAVYTLHELEGLRRLGCLEGRDVTTVLGWCLFKELRNIGFKPTKQESRAATACLMATGSFKIL